jgi:hypothetical protein
MVRDYRRGLDWIPDLLTTCVHHLKLQIITANLHNSQITTVPAKPSQSCCIFNSRSVATASNRGRFFRFPSSGPLVTANRAELL